MPKTSGEKKAFKAGIVKGMGLVDEGLPGWFGTFADMMTLLFAFFVLLAALSTMDPVKIMEMANSTGKSLGSKIKKEGAAELEGEFEKKATKLSEVKASLDEMVEKIESEMKNTKGDPPVEVTTSAKGVTLEISGDFSFGSGSARISPGLKKLLTEKIVPEIKNSIFQIEVAGHTDSDALPKTFQKRFPSNWELSTARGSSVVRNIISQGVDPTRLVAAGYADWVPRGQAGNLTQKIDRNTVLELNNTPEKKGRNRRIEITFLKPAHHTTSYVENEG
jgi:chemotaxis protein MotB